MIFSVLIGGTGRAETGVASWSSSSSINITLGYRPSFVVLYATKNSTHFTATYCIDNSDSSTFIYTAAYNNGTVSYTRNSTGSITINDDGFTINKVSSATISAYGSTTKWIAGQY